MNEAVEKAVRINDEIKATDQHFRTVMAEPTPTAEVLAADGIDLNKVDLWDYYYIATIADEASDWRTCQAVIPAIQACIKREQYLWADRRKREPKGGIISLADSMKIAAETDGEIKAAERHFRLVMAEPTPTATALVTNGVDLDKVNLWDYYHIAEISYRNKDWRTRQAVIQLIMALLKREMLKWETKRKYGPQS